MSSNLSIEHQLRCAFPQHSNMDSSIKSACKNKYSWNRMGHKDDSLIKQNPEPQHIYLRKTCLTVYERFNEWGVADTADLQRVALKYRGTCWELPAIFQFHTLLPSCLLSQLTLNKRPFHNANEPYACIIYLYSALNWWAVIEALHHCEMHLKTDTK